jgi:hypothetical protein
VALSSEVQTEEITIQAPITTASAFAKRMSTSLPFYVVMLVCVTCLLVGSLLCLLLIQLVRRRRVPGKVDDECSSTVSTRHAPCDTTETNSPSPIYVDWSANRIHRIVTPKMSKRYASSVHPELDGDGLSVRTEVGVAASPGELEQLPQTAVLKRNV